MRRWNFLITTILMTNFLIALIVSRPAIPCSPSQDNSIRISATDDAHFNVPAGNEPEHLHKIENESPDFNNLYPHAFASFECEDLLSLSQFRQARDPFESSDLVAGIFRPPIA